ncbi:MAG: NUDIX domain-containing protein [Nocardioides sp.]
MTARQRIAAYGIARRGDSILLVREPTTGAWWLPGGGVNFGEAPADALAREFEEEVGATIALGRFVGVLSDVAPLSTELVLLHSVRIIYEVGLAPTEQLRPEADGSTETPEWMPTADLDQLPMPPWLTGWLPGHLAQH